MYVLRVTFHKSPEVVRDDRSQLSPSIGLHMKGLSVYR